MGMKNQEKKLKNRPKFQRSNNFVSCLGQNAPFSYVEAYKTLRTNLEFISTASQAKCVVVTSALPEESKSTVSINLALTLADSQKSVILVECDLRKPTIRRYLKLERGLNGLSAVLSGSAPLDECIQVAEEGGIHILTAGTIPPNPSELLNQPRMAALIEELKQRYDYVILDAPPVTVVTDAAVVGRMADGALLVIRSKYAPTKRVRQALQRLKDVDIRVLGAVLTRQNVKKSGGRYDYDYDGYEYGYRQSRSGT